MAAARKALRADALAALTQLVATAPALSGAQILSAWAQDIDPATLPAIGLATPASRREPVGQDIAEDVLTLVIIVKRKGGEDLEDRLDDDAEALSDPLAAALIREDRGVMLSSSAMELSGAGSPRIGTLTLTFEATTWAPRVTP